MQQTFSCISFEASGTTRIDDQINFCMNIKLFIAGFNNKLFKKLSFEFLKHAKSTYSCIMILCVKEV